MSSACETPCAQVELPVVAQHLSVQKNQSAETAPRPAHVHVPGNKERNDGLHPARDQSWRYRRGRGWRRSARLAPDRRRAARLSPAPSRSPTRRRNGGSCSRQSNMRCCASRIPSVPHQSAQQRASHPAPSPAPDATCRSSIRKPNSTAGQAGRASTSPSRARC